VEGKDVVKEYAMSRTYRIIGFGKVIVGTPRE
jgi:hypothetical protein